MEVGSESDYIRRSFRNRKVCVKGVEVSVVEMLSRRGLIKAYVKERPVEAANFYLRTCDCGEFREGFETLGNLVLNICKDEGLRRDVRERMNRFGYDVEEFGPRLPKYRKSSRRI